jgi:hypothetical protein
MLNFGFDPGTLADEIWWVEILWCASIDAGPGVATTLESPEANCQIGISYLPHAILFKQQ